MPTGLKYVPLLHSGLSTLEVLMHLSSASPGWGTPGIPGGIAAFYIKVIQFSEPSGMISKQSLHPGQIRKAMRQWETMAATH